MCNNRVPTLFHLLMSVKETEMPTGAAARVFGITELLENILTHLTELGPKDSVGRNAIMRQLFLMQGVNTISRGTIRFSKRLRIAMFLETPSKDTVEEAMLNPLSPHFQLGRRVLSALPQVVRHPSQRN